MKQKTKISLLVGSFLLLSTGLVQAQNGARSEQWKGMTDEEKAAKKEEVQVKAEDRWKTITCKKVETRMQARYQKYQTNKTLHKQAYDKMVTKVELIIADYKKRGVDVSKVEEDLALLEKKLEKLYVDHDALMEKMKENSTGLCSQSKDTLGSKIQEIQKYRLETIKVDMLDIRTFYSTVLRPDLIALAQELKATISPAATPSPSAVE